MIAKLLVIHDSQKNTLEAVDPKDATGIAIPTAIVVNTLPATGQVAGEVYMVKPTKTAYVYDGSTFLPIVPSAILSYPTDAAVYADTAPPVGSYALSADTGNLFAKVALGWRQIGVRYFADEANMNADPDALEGDLAYCYDTQTHYSYDGFDWQRLQGPIINVSMTAPAGAVSGDLWYDQTKRELNVSDGTNWLKAYDGLSRTGDGHFRIDSANTAALEFINAGAAKNFGIDSRDQTGPRFWVSNSGTINNFLEVLPTGENYFPHGFQDIHHIKGEIELGANAATAQRIVLIKNIPVAHEPLTIDIADKYTSGIKATYTLHAIGTVNTQPSLIPIHIQAQGSHFSDFSMYWDGTAYVLSAMLNSGGNNGVKYDVSVRCHTRDISGIAFDGNTVSTETGGPHIRADISYYGVPRLAAYKTIGPHDFNADVWEYNNYHIPVPNYIPEGNLYRMDVAINFFAYHGGKIYLMGKIEDNMTGGGREPRAGWYRIEPVADYRDSNFLQMSKGGIVGPGGELLFKLGTFGTAGSPNNDRQGWGTILLYDLGPTAGVPVIP